MNSIFLTSLSLDYPHLSLKEAINLFNAKELEAALAKLTDKTDKPEIKNWFKTQYVKWVKAQDEKNADFSVEPHVVEDGDPEWAKKPGIFDFKEFSTSHKDHISHIIDFLNSYDATALKSLYKETYDVIDKKVKEYDKQLANQKVGKNPLKEGEDFKVVFKSGKLKWVQLLNRKACEYEGPAMGHCIGKPENAETYNPKKDDFFSLYDELNEPHVTIETVKADKTIRQIKGKANKSPVEAYLPITRAFVDRLIADGYKLEGDGENIGYREHEGEYHNPDSDKWKKIDTEIIQPRIKKLFDSIYARIVEK